LRGTGKRPPRQGSKLRMMATADPARAELLIMSALAAMRGKRIAAAKVLCDAGLLAHGAGAYLALWRCVDEIPGLQGRIDAAFGARRAPRGGTIDRVEEKA